MQQRTALLGVVIAAVTTLAAPAQATPAAPHSAQGEPAPNQGEPAKTITLITGDKVTLRTLPTKETQLDVAPAPAGRRSTSSTAGPATGSASCPWTPCPCWPRAGSTPGCSTSPNWPRSATTTPPARGSRSS
ncbi:hypothetical protein ACFQYP_08865 [Nonomuraea antimicrobica]